MNCTLCIVRFKTCLFACVTSWATSEKSHRLWCFPRANYLLVTLLARGSHKTRGSASPPDRYDCFPSKLASSRHLRAALGSLFEEIVVREALRGHLWIQLVCESTSCFKFATSVSQFGGELRKELELLRKFDSLSSLSLPCCFNWAAFALVADQVQAIFYVVTLFQESLSANKAEQTND